MVWLDDDLQTAAEVRLPGSGATDGIRSLRVGDGAEVIANANLAEDVIVTLSPEGSIVSMVAADPDSVLWSPHSPTGWLGGERSDCLDENGGESWGTAVFLGFEGAQTQWEASFDCSAITGLAVDASTSIVSLGCRGPGDTITGELHRIVVE